MGADVAAALSARPRTAHQSISAPCIAATTLISGGGNEQIALRPLLTGG